MGHAAEQGLQSNSRREPMEMKGTKVLVHWRLEVAKVPRYYLYPHPTSGSVKLSRFRGWLWEGRGVFAKNLQDDDGLAH